MITILTTPKPTIGKHKVDFINAMRSWRRLQPEPEILVFGGDRQLVKSEGGRYIGKFPATTSGLPYLDGMFSIARELATHDILMLTSDHLIVLPGLMEAVWRAREKFGVFLAVGQRHDVDISAFINYSEPRWTQKVRQYISAGRLHGPSAKDYMIVPKEYPLRIPPFIVGRPWYDSWFVASALDANIPVVDLTRTVSVVHPNHNYSQIPGNPLGNHGNPGERYNAQLADGVAGKGHVTTSQWIDTPNGIRAREPNDASTNAPKIDVSQNYADPKIAAKQRGIVDRQLKEMRAGKPPAHFASYGKVLQYLRTLTDSPKFSLLDAGCGSAYYYEISEHYVPGWLYYTGLDYNPGMVALAKEHYPGITVRQADLRSMKLTKRSFDIVLSGAAIMHIQEWEKAVAELANAAKRFLILHRTWVHTDNTPTSGLLQNTYDVTAWFGTINEQELISLVGTLGLNLIHHCESGEGQRGPNQYIKTYVFERPTRAT